MGKAKRVIALLMMIALVFTTRFTGNSTKVLADTTTSNDTSTTASQKYAEAMEPGWNLGNTFDSFDTNGDKGEISWGNPVVTKDLIKTMKAQGFKSIRIPFTSYMRTGDAPDYKLDADFLARYAEVVGWALDEGLYVMINLHHDSWSWANTIGSDDGTSLKKYKAIWTQLADYFKDYPDKLCFESLNEPQFTVSGEEAQLKVLENLNKEFYHLVRTSGGNNATRMLILPTLNTNDSESRCKSLYNTIQELNDKNIIATFHYYGYWPFSTNIAGTTTMDDTVVKELHAAFDRVYNNFVNKGIGVICGEYGVLAFDKSLGAIEHGEMLKYFEYINYYAKQKQITMMLWDNGQHMGRTSYQWSDPSLYNIIKTSWTGRSSYSETDRLFVKTEDKAKALSTKLILNGNTLSSIYNGTKKLVLGKDYTYENETVTFTGKYMNRIIQNSYGVNATLTLKFSAGPDWTLYINHIKTPVLKSNTGTTAGFDIPVSFNGDVISTVEAAYEDGTGAGPQNWTTYKEYDYAFSVDYDLGKVIMKDKFFAETKDGIIDLKLHFQSGVVLNYTIKKDGTTVTCTNIPILVTNTLTLKKGKTEQISLQYVSENAKTTYTSSNKKVVKVFDNGTIKALKAGKAVITVTVVQDGITYSYNVSISIK